MAEKSASGTKGSSRVSVDYNGGDALQVRSRNSSIKGFLPRDGVATPGDVRDGSDPGFRPGELLLSSLGTCIAGMMAIYARSNRYPLDGISVTLDDIMAENPARIGGIAARVSLSGDLTPEQRDRLHKIAARCKVSDTLKHPMDITVTFDPPAPAEPD
jgi:putative redox protein